MKKLKCYLVLLALVAFMASCVDIQEPQGIQDVRSAKVDFLKAQTSLQLAEAKLTEAKAATELANAKLQEAYAKAQLLQNSADSSHNAQDKARFELELKVLQAQNQVNLLNIQSQVAAAQRVYQQALADLAMVKTVGIPQMYMNRLDQIKNELLNTLNQISNVENLIIDRNLRLNLWVSRDSLNYDYTLRTRITNKTKELLLAQNVLTTVTQLKTANQTELDRQKADVTAKRQALVTEGSSIETRINNLNVELADLNKQNANYSYQLNSKRDYTFTLAIPQKIRLAVYNQYAGSLLFKSDTTTVSHTNYLGTVLNWSQNIKNYATTQKAANPTVPEWDTFLIAATAVYDGFLAAQKQLMGAQNDLLITINHKNAELNSLSSNLSMINSYISSYDNILNSINNNLNGLDIQILNAQNSVTAIQADLAGANADLAAWLKGYTNNGWGDYYSVKDQYLRDITSYQNQLKDLKDRFDALTKQKDEMVKLINDYK